MFAWLVGNIDLNSAIVLAVMLVVIGVISTTMIVTHRSKLELEMQFEVDKTKLRNQEAADKRQADHLHETALTKLALEKEVTFRRIETGLIEGKAN